MALNLKGQLLSEYVKRIKFIYTPLVKLGGLGRFDVKHGKIVSVSRLSQLYSILLILTADICGYVLLLETAVNHKLLIFPEYVSVITYMLFHNTTVLNIIFAKRHSGAEIVNNFIEIDEHMGIKETKFLRVINNREFLIWCGLMVMFEILVNIILNLIFKVPPVIFIAGLIFFTVHFSVCYEHVFHVAFYEFLSLRIHYLNVSLVKIANLEKEYLTQQLLSYPFLWKKEYNDSENFHMEADTQYFTETLKMLFNQLQMIAKSYQYLLFSVLGSVIMSTLLAVQSIIMYIKDPEMFVIRISHLTGWFVVNWIVVIGIAHKLTKFQLQVQRTKLICTYIQLNPDNSDEILHLSESILDVLSASEWRASVYGLFHFDGGLVRAIASSVFVYITIQLQIAFPKQTDQNK